MEKRKCPECGMDFYGRADKKFCGDSCRNSWNNKIRSKENSMISHVNVILKKNRKILAEVNPEGRTRIQKTTLLSKGFNFNYFTNIYKTNSGKEYYFCYDQGYLFVDEDYVKVVLKEEWVK